jgi:regulator of cell morphogenesis and NO signaling
MTITESTTVAEIASALPSSVRIFEDHGIDFCCGGKRPLAIVCQEVGVRFADVAAAIEASASQPAAEKRDWNREPLSALIDHIITTYHDSLRIELPRLEAMAAKVTRVHGARAPYLARVEAVLTELSADLLVHMRKEEAVLFPAIRTNASAHDAAIPITAAITMMEHDHDRAGELLAELRRLTGGYAAPGWACGTLRALYDGLSKLESSMHVHVHLENNVLFPRALGSIGIF